MITLEHYTKVHHRDTYPEIDETKAGHSCAGKSIFITGAGTGIGKAIALSFARASAHAIFLAGRTLSTIEQTKKEVQQYSPECIVECYVMDVANEAEVCYAFKHAGKRLDGRGLDVLVSNAGYVAYLEKASTSSFEEVWRHFEINVKGSWLVISTFLKYAVENGATVINVSSGAAVINMAGGLSAYSASKVATMKMLDYAHREEAVRGLRIFNIHPGVVPTAMAAAGKQNMQDTGTSLVHRLRVHHHCVLCR